MENVNEYIKQFPSEVQFHLEQLRQTIKSIAPEAVELISYKMPAYKTNGKILVYFAGYKKHIGLYATPKAHTEFSSELACYKQGKGSVQFPIDQPLPLDLISKIVRFRMEENRIKK